MEKTNLINVNQGETIEWKRRDIISVVRDMSLPFGLENASSVAVETMPSGLREDARKIVQPKACYCNAFRMVLNSYRNNFRYVIGYASASVIFDHAWIKVGDKYYDPTWELYGSQIGDEYLPLYELSLGELISTMNEMDTREPPCALSLYYFRSRSSQC